MSKDFLLNLNGTNGGGFYDWLHELDGDPRIAWYPSAGVDFRDLLYLSSNYSEINPADAKEPSPPDIFLHTDYFSWSESMFFEGQKFYSDGRSSVTITYIEELPPLGACLDRRLVDFPEGNQGTGRVFFLKVDVTSDVLGSFSAPVLYAFVENTEFCATRALPQDASFSHIIHVRYGGGCGGGGKSTGSWLLNVLSDLKCECFISDGHYGELSKDSQVYKLYPELSGPEDVAQLEPIRVIPSATWSGHGDVSWNLIRSA